MWTLIILGLVFLGWYIMSPQGEAEAAAEAAPEAPSAPPSSAGDNAITDGSEFSSAAPDAAEAPAAEAPAESAGSSDDDPFKAP